MNRKWYPESLYSDFQQSFEIENIVFEGRTKFQEMVIFENKRFGRVLALDGVIQTTEADEFCYHEMMTHVPLVAHGDTKNVLIIGGGDGGVLREAIKHPLDRVTMIELDETVVQLCREHMPSLSNGAFDDPKADLRFMDGIKFVSETSDTFDVIIVDSTDPIGPGEVLFTEEFYRNCARCLTERGILITQSGVAWMQEEEARATFKRMESIFLDPNLYITQVPTYAAGLMTLGWGSKSKEPRLTPKSEIEKRISGLNLESRYYNAEIHEACFSLPAYIENLKN